ncbi:MAG TPA: PaaI family thioesterase [Vicinamibacterales bacterium]|jgi:acyl-coenzyme A thioesterase PaaI-like protein
MSPAGGAAFQVRHGRYAGESRVLDESDPSGGAFVSETRVRTFPHCYVCGAENKAGLHVPFSPDPAGGSRAEYVAQPEHVGWPGIIHGGLLFTLMDEAVASACTFAGLYCVTAKADARFRVSARVGMRLVITGRITFSSQRAVRARAEIRAGSDTGDILAELEAMMAITDPARFDMEARDGRQP